MGCVQSYFRRAQTPGISPSSTEESHSKIQANEPVIAAENGKKTPVSTEEKIPEEPESNDTSYGVEATAVRTLAASTGTVAILGTTAKTLESQDEETKEDTPDVQENLPTSKSPEEPSNKTEPGRTEDSIVPDIQKEVTGSSIDFIDASPSPHMPVESVIKTEETVDSIHTEDVIEIDVKKENIGVLEKEKPNTTLESDLQKIEIPVMSELSEIEVVQPTEQTINQTNDAEEIENNLVEAISASETPVDKEQDNKGTHLDNRVSVNIEPTSVPEADNPPQDSEQTSVKKEDEIILNDYSGAGETEEQNGSSLDMEKPSEVLQIEKSELTEPEDIVADVVEVKTPDPSNEEQSSTPSDLEIAKQVGEIKDESPVDKLESDSMEELLIVAENVDSGNESDTKDTATNTPETLVVSESADNLRIDKEDNASGTIETELIPNQIKDGEESVPALDEPSFGSSVEDETNHKKEESPTETSKEVKSEEEVASAASEIKLVYESNGQHIVLGVDEEDITKSISSEQLQTNSASDVSISESYNVEMEEANGKSDLVYHRNDIGGSHQNSNGNTRNITIVLTNENNDVVDRESEEFKKEMEYLQDVKHLEETKKKINDDSSSDEHEDKMPIEESSKQEGEETTSTETLSSCKGTDEDSDAKIPSPTPNDETKLTASENVQEGETEVEKETMAPEEVDNGILNSAATTIQASFRGYQTRQNLQKETLKTSQDAEVRSGNATPPELSNSMIESVKEEVDEICQQAIETTESIINSPSSAPIDDILHQSEQISAAEQKETDDVMKTLDQSIEGQEELSQNQSNAPDQSAISTETVQERPKSSEGVQEQTINSTEDTKDVELVSDNQQGQLISAEENKEDVKSLQKQDSLNSDPNDTLVINDDSSNNGDLSKEFVPPEVPTGQNDEINEAMADFPPPAPEDDYIFGEQVADEELPPPDFDALESSYTDDIETEVPLASPEHKPEDEVNQEDVKDSTDGEVTIDEDSDELKLLQRPQECAELPHQQGMDALQSEALEAAAATKIQAGVRGYLTRKQVQHVKNDPIITTESDIDNKLVEPTEVEVDVDEENIINKAKEMTNSSSVTAEDKTASEIVEENNKNQIEEKKLNTDEQNLDGLTEAATTIQAGFRGYKVRKQLQEDKKTANGSENGSQRVHPDTIRSTGEFHDMIALSPLSVEVKGNSQ